MADPVILSHPCVEVSLAAYPGVEPERALRMAIAGAEDPVFGVLSCNEVQICPQNSGRLTPESAADLRQRWPDKRFRLHANARVADWTVAGDLAHFNALPAYVEALGAVHAALGARAYTVHPGPRACAPWSQVVDTALRLEDQWGLPVGVEGMYPTPSDRFHASHWDEYARFLETPALHFAIDLSHVHILATQCGQRQITLLSELLACERCIEVHVAGNDGLRDSHGTSLQPCWWYPVMDRIHPGAVIFSESNQLLPRYFQ